MAPISAAENQRNQAILKKLLKEPGNKVCADCKQNNHPRWASWNLGIFICIRCSGIHRSMGTHISRVKSVDLDSWSDEQVGNMIKWGNSKANSYWEANLPSGHIPPDSKIANFIRTKYERKRWCSSDLPQNSSQNTSSNDVSRTNNNDIDFLNTQTVVSSSNPRQDRLASRARDANMSLTNNLLDINTHTTTSSTTSANTPATTNKTSTTTTPASAKSTNPLSSPTTNSRADLKSSILSLYASAPLNNKTPQIGSQFGSNINTNPNSSVNSLSNDLSGLSFTQSYTPVNKPYTSSVSPIMSVNPVTTNSVTSNPIKINLTTNNLVNPSTTNNLIDSSVPIKPANSSISTNSTSKSGSAFDDLLSLNSNYSSAQKTTPSANNSITSSFGIDNSSTNNLGSNSSSMKSFGTNSSIVNSFGANNSTIAPTSTKKPPGSGLKHVVIENASDDGNDDEFGDFVSSSNPWTSNTSTEPKNTSYKSSVSVPVSAGAPPEDDLFANVWS